MKIELRSQLLALQVAGVKKAKNGKCGKVE